MIFQRDAKIIDKALQNTFSKKKVKKKIFANNVRLFMLSLINLRKSN